MNFFKDQHQSY